MTLFKGIAALAGTGLRRGRGIQRRVGRVGVLLMAAFAGVLAAVSPGVMPGENVRVANAADFPLVSVTAAAPFQFTPKTLTVTAGTAVRWAPGGATPHTITSDGCGDPRAGICYFDSGTTEFVRAGTPRSSFEVVFANPGVYNYFCRLHGGPGGVAQAGTVVVQAAPGGSAPTGLQPLTATQLRPAVSLAIQAPRDGDVVSGDKVTVQLQVTGASPRVPVTGATNAAYGHYNLILDANPDLSAQIGAGPAVTRANGNQATLENVPPGSHTLTAVWTYDNNVAPQPPITASVRFTTRADGGSSVTPPRTGDAGLRDASAGGSARALFGGLAAMLAATGVFVLGRRRV